MALIPACGVDIQILCVGAGCHARPHKKALCSIDNMTHLQNGLHVLSRK
jgi:hypothetical protein